MSKKIKTEWKTIKVYNYENILLSLLFSALVIYQLIVVEIILLNSAVESGNLISSLLSFLLLIGDTFIIGIICVFFGPYYKKYKVMVREDV